MIIVEFDVSEEVEIILAIRTQISKLKEKRNEASAGNHKPMWSCLNGDIKKLNLVLKKIREASKCETSEYLGRLERALSKCSDKFAELGYYSRVQEIESILGNEASND